MHFNTKLVGVTFNDSQSRISRLKKGEIIYLRHEPSNEFDKNAIRADNANGQILGHLSAELARSVAFEILNGKNFFCYVLAVTGGNQYYYGVNVHVDIFDIQVRCKVCSTYINVPFIECNQLSQKVVFKCTKCHSIVHEVNGLVQPSQSNSSNSSTDDDDSYSYPEYDEEYEDFSDESYKEL